MEALTLFGKSSAVRRMSWSSDVCGSKIGLDPKSDPLSRPMVSTEMKSETIPEMGRLQVSLLCFHIGVNRLGALVLIGLPNKNNSGLQFSSSLQVLGHTEIHVATPGIPQT